MDKNKTAVEIFNRHAQSYQDRFMNVDLYADTFDLFCSSIATEEAELLELACGPGNITRYLLKARPSFRILGTDLAPQMVELAKINNPRAEFRIMDCRELGALEKKYDGIMCGFCLPYLSPGESVKLIANASVVLKPGGVLYLSTMEEDDDNRSGIRTSSQGDQMYMYYHRADYLTRSLEENGLKIIELKRQDYPVQGGIKTTDLVIIAGK